jgi:hypothetical protein
MTQAGITIDRETSGDAWRAQIRVLDLTRGQVFQVLAETNGAHGYTADYYDASTLELAAAVYEDAVTRLAAHRMPNLRHLAARHKRRDPRLISLTRNADGATVAGDTAHDELEAS